MTPEQLQYVVLQRTNADSDRTQWQWYCIQSWGDSNFRASIEAATGSGKSRIGLYAIQFLRRNGINRRVMIIVPTLQLKDQWEKELKKWKLHNNTAVWVINSAIKYDHTCDLLILDEIHRMAAPTFVQLFDRVKYNYILGLTATMQRLDRKDNIIRKYAPIKRKLSLAEAKSKGWIADFKEYWLGLDMIEEHRVRYDKLDESFVKNMGPFEMDWTLMIISMSDHDVRQRLADQVEGYSEWNIMNCARSAIKAMAAMREMISKNHVKTAAAYELIKALDRKTITFGTSIKAAESLTDWLGKKAMCFHSMMSPIMVETFKDKEFKTLSGAMRNEAKTGGEYKFKHNKHVVQHRVEKKIAGKKLRDYVLHKIINTQQVNVMCTAKALNEGFDYPGAQLGVTLSRSQSDTTYIQQTGRVARLSEGVDPIMVHVYFKDTRDEKWLRRAGRSAVGVIKVNSVEELLSSINTTELVTM